MLGKMLEEPTTMEKSGKKKEKNKSSEEWNLMEWDRQGRNFKGLFGGVTQICPTKKNDLLITCNLSTLKMPFGLRS